MYLLSIFCYIFYCSYLIDVAEEIFLLATQKEEPRKQLATLLLRKKQAKQCNAFNKHPHLACLLNSTPVGPGQPVGQQTDVCLPFLEDQASVSLSSRWYVYKKEAGEAETLLLASALTSPASPNITAPACPPQAGVCFSSHWRRGSKRQPESALR
jgi:hypothetical protein